MTSVVVPLSFFCPIKVRITDISIRDLMIETNLKNYVVYTVCRILRKAQRIRRKIFF